MLYFTPTQQSCSDFTRSLLQAIIDSCCNLSGDSNMVMVMQLLRPIYKRMAENHNAEIFAANTLLVVLGTSVMTARV